MINLNLAQNHIDFDGWNSLILQAVYADEPPYDTPQFREMIKCVDGVFTEVMEKYSELKKHYPEFQALAEKTNLKLNECDKADNADAKNE